MIISTTTKDLNRLLAGVNIWKDSYNEYHMDIRILNKRGTTPVDRKYLNDLKKLSELMISTAEKMIQKSDV